MWCYTLCVPTHRPRHTVTETDVVRQALDIAARRWPHDRGRRSRLLMRVVRDWMRSEEGRAERHRTAILRTSGTVPGVFPAGHLDELRGEWPE
jgi:hypothetical protein